MPVPLSEVLKQKNAGIYTVKPECTISHCVEKMNTHKVGAVPVLNEGKIVGIFTERDLLKKVIPLKLDATLTPVKEVMTENVISIKPDVSISEAMDIISTKRIRHLPIVEFGELLGILSSGDLMKWLMESQELLIETLCTDKLANTK